RPTRPSVSRKATSSSPITVTRTGGPSGAGSSWERSTGTQKRRKNSPIGVPAPVRVKSSLSLALSIASPPGDSATLASPRSRRRPSQRRVVRGHAPARRGVGDRAGGGGQIVGGVLRISRRRDRAGDGGVAKDPLEEELRPAGTADLARPVGQRDAAHAPEHRARGEWAIHEHGDTAVRGGLEEPAVGLRLGQRVVELDEV